MENGQQKRRKASRSLIEDYQQKKIVLPFIKPRYMNEEMFNSANKLKNSSNSTPRTFSTQKQSKRSNNSRVQTEPVEKIVSNRHNLNAIENQVSRYKLKDFYRNISNGKIMLHEVNIKQYQKPHKIEQPSNDSPFHHSFLQRRKKRYSVRQINDYQRQKRQEISGQPRDEVVHKTRVLYTPVLLNRQIIENKESYQEVQFGEHLKKGVIKKQEVKKFLLEKARKAMMRLNIAKKKRRVFNAILFIVYLKRFNAKFRAGRKRFIEKIGVENIKSKLTELKLFLSAHLHPFYQVLSSKCDQLYLIHENQQKVSANQKISGLKKIIKILIDCILRASEDMNGRTSITQIVYAICKHGSFASFWQIHTVQQLDISCLSNETGYLSADRFLQYSGIISLVFIKIIIFNLMLQPQTINFSVNPSKDKSKIYFNIKLIANIFYELMITIQDKYLQMADEKFKVGNWRDLAYKFNIRTSESLTTKEGFLQKNELISGLIGHSYIRQLYQIDEMETESRILEEQVLKIHILLKKYHETIRIGCM